MYVIDNHELNLEYISNHEFANVTRLRNLYLVPKKIKIEEPTKPVQQHPITENKKKELPKQALPEPNPQVNPNYQQYMNGMYNRVFPINIMPYTNISINQVAGGQLLLNMDERQRPINPGYYYQMYQPYPYYGFGIENSMPPVVYHQNEAFNFNYGMNAPQPRQDKSAQ